ncbi:hypothetical protein D9619_006095 [Psilocybe cf. subviscida]|uniref:Protein kinase domain-containing protein n=1 Tax=Psilocybe cf. subviscida TaxID=2480587 RepID=A0A8H5EYE5_9AGAR|nr:hypothetical protein D9619_006095 [Psilocybe cf. subviscida]
MTIIPLEPKTPTGQTFKPSQLPNVRGTPRRAPQDADDELTNEIRARVAKAMNSETLLCSIDKFLAHYGPYKVKPNDVKDCKAALIKTGILKRSGGDYRWAKYQKNPSEMASDMDPNNTERTEPKIFAHMLEIVEKIYSYAGARRENEYKFELVPYRYLKAAIGGTNHKMDACIVEAQTPGKLDVSTGIAPHEFKVERDATDQIEVRQQIVGDCQHIMCDDPRRMFMFGVTIEDAFFSLWYLSRSHSVKALAFNWLTGKGIDRFIEIYLSFAFAKPADLGVDPHVKKASPPDPEDKEGQQYIYELPVQEAISSNDDTQGRRTRQAAAADRLKTQTFKYFKTVHEINQMRPYCISGRTTRIWVVTEVKSFDDEDPVENGKHVILKDVWLEADKPTEAENMVKIFEDVEKRLALAKEAGGDGWMVHFMQNDECFTEFDQGTKDRLQDLLTDDKYKSLFLTKIHAWKGRVSKEVSTSAKFSRKGVDIFAEVKRVGEEPKANRAPTKTWTETRTQSNPSGPLEGKARTVKDPKAFRRYAPRQQSRFVYEEVCLELADVKTMGNFMHVINQALDALRILFCAGWVHRDISEGNILTYTEDGEWKVKLSDLEFSEKLGYGQSRTDPRTGTPYYIVELSPGRPRRAGKNAGAIRLWGG